MQHLDPDRLVLLALSEQQQEPGETDHLADCAGCRHDLGALREVAELGVEGSELRDLPPPPEHVWRAIEAEISAPVTVLSERRGRTRRSRPRWLTPLVAAAAAAIVAVGGTVTAIRLLDRTPPETWTARATLTPLPTVPATASGSARVLGDGRMRVDVRNLPLTTGFHEVWLLDPDDPTRMVAIGNLPDGPNGVVLPVPPGTDLNRYRLVDVSDEPHDGDATHSGKSLLRGMLTS
ncbi:anti-sigma factor [Actinoplanes sp. NPDC049802]|uniref:anti-sigma factor n=1 Tax=Actinoplanes sp. NPDC049802 TaxID=3154742 RepID=UPI00340FE26A